MKKILKKASSRKKKKNILRGFTIIELLISVGIIVVIASIILFAINRSRARAADARTQETMGTIRTVATEDHLESGSYTPTFSDGGSADAVVDLLASQNDIGPADYDIRTADDEFVLVFPLAAETGYWCVDANGTSKKVEGKPKGTAPYTCENVHSGSGNGDEDDEGSNTPPVLTVSGSTGNCSADKTFCFLASFPNIRLMFPPVGTYTQSPSFAWNGVTVIDDEDGDLTYNVAVAISQTSSSGAGAAAATRINSEGYGIAVTGCSDTYYRLAYSVSDSDGNRVSHSRALYSCTGDESGGSGGEGSPTITLNGNNPEYVNPKNYVDPVTASDPQDGDLTSQISATTSFVSWTAQGVSGECTKKRSYSVNDSEGNGAFKERTFVYSASEISCNPSGGGGGFQFIPL